MTVVITNGNGDCLKAYKPESIRLLIVITAEYTHAAVRKLLDTVYPKVEIGGSIIIAESLPAAFERL